MRYTVSVERNGTLQEKAYYLIMRTVIAVASHKRYPVREDKLYLPVMAGSVFMTSEETSGYLRDDSGDNISDRNPGYSELTVLYWMWKHCDADNIGICHYRRYFTVKSFLRRSISFAGISKRSNGKLNAVLTYDEADELLKDNRIILPAPRNYFIETNYSQFAHAHGAEALDEARSILEAEYRDAFDRRMSMTSGHRFNMFIMRKSLMDEYCTWLFGVLFELERRLGLNGSQACSDRIYGFVAERLLDVWIDAKGYEYYEIPWIFMEREHNIRKITGLIIRKLRAAQGKRRKKL